MFQIRSVFFMQIECLDPVFCFMPLSFCGIVHCK